MYTFLFVDRLLFILYVSVSLIKRKNRSKQTTLSTQSKKANGRIISPFFAAIARDASILALVQWEILKWNGLKRIYLSTPTARACWQSRAKSKDKFRHGIFKKECAFYISPMPALLSLSVKATILPLSRM